MKKTSIVLLFLAVFGYTLVGQTATNLTYKFDNGVVVKTEHDWGQIWIQQKQEAFVAGEEPKSVDISTRIFGELAQQTTFRLTSGGKDVKLKEASPGTYSLKMTGKLIGKPGVFSFDVEGIVVKPKMKTTVTITVYKYQVSIEEAAATNKGLAGFESKVAWYKGAFDQTFKVGIPTFYAKGAHENKIAPDVATNDISGKIKPGTYDVLITIDISGHSQKIWLENMAMKADVNYKLIVNMNAGTIAYAGSSRDVKQIHLYPAGTADKVQGNTKVDKATEVISYEPATSTFACRPGSYDALLVIGNGTRNEWKKGIVVRSGIRTDIK